MIHNTRAHSEILRQFTDSLAEYNRIHRELDNTNSMRMMSIGLRLDNSNIYHKKITKLCGQLAMVRILLTRDITSVILYEKTKLTSEVRSIIVGYI